MYGLETRVLNQAVSRKLSRFPRDFTFTLSREEVMRISQIVISSPGHKTLKFAKNVRVFSEQGVAMLSGVLNSERAIQVNIAIMRTFVKLRQIIASNSTLSKKLDELEAKYDKQFKVVFDALRELMTPPERPKKRIGFITD